ncbi:Ig-like domain-containing protein [Bacillus sp. V2I10]|uniref:Ig-like domain-containing protein n=1 Tax=Bacillus sp. V2I10 TaxID=3042276 RepID=UPI0035934668
MKDVTVKANAGETIMLPETVNVTYNDGNIRSINVTWDKEALKKAVTNGVGTYVIEGVIEGGYTVKAHLQILPQNEILNPGFEDSDRSMWNITYGNGSTPHTNYQEKVSDAKSGNYSLHFYSGTAVNFNVEQTITGLEPGYYNLSMFLQGGDAHNSEMFMYARSGDAEHKINTSVNGWINWSNPEIADILVTDGTITIGARLKADAGAWGTLDDFYLYRATDR